MQATQAQATQALEAAAVALAAGGAGAARAGLAVAMDWAATNVKELMPRKVRWAAKRQGLPVVNNLLVEDLLALCVKHGEGHLPRTHLERKLREMGWKVPTDLEEVLGDHGFALVQGVPGTPYYNQYTRFLALA